jgi:uncharacterized protein
MDFKEFVNKNYLYAVVGVSEDKNKWGRKIFDILNEKKFHTAAINPKYKEIDGQPCFENLEGIGLKPDVVILAVPPKVSEEIVNECIKLGISKVWMQPGSQSEKSIRDCIKNNILCIHDACFLVNGLEKLPKLE